MVNYMKIRVNIEHELLCERFEREWPYNYPLILVAGCGSRRNSGKRRKNFGASFSHFRAFCGTYNKFIVNYMEIHVDMEHEWLRARRFLASGYKQVCLFSAYRKRWGSAPSFSRLGIKASFSPLGLSKTLNFNNW